MVEINGHQYEVMSCDECGHTDWHEIIEQSHICVFCGQKEPLQGHVTMMKEDHFLDIYG